MVVGPVEPFLHVDPARGVVDGAYGAQRLAVVREQLVAVARLELLRRKRIAVDWRLRLALRRRSADEREPGDDGAFVEKVVLVDEVAQPEELPQRDLVF